MSVRYLSIERDSSENSSIKIREYRSLLKTPSQTKLPNQTNSEISQHHPKITFPLIHTRPPKPKTPHLLTIPTPHPGPPRSRIKILPTQLPRPPFLREIELLVVV